MTKNGQRRRKVLPSLAVAPGGAARPGRRAAPTGDWEAPMADWLRWTAAHRKETTLKDCRSRGGLVRAWAEAQGVAFDKFRAKHLDSYLDARAEKGLSDTTRRHDAIICKAFLKWAFQEGYLRSNPLAGYEIPKAKTPPRYVPSAEEVGKLLQAVADCWDVRETPSCRFVYEKARRFYLRRDLALITGLIATGARISEMLGLRLEDWRMDRGEQGEVTFRETKNGEDRTLPVSPLWREAVEEYLLSRPRCANPHLFVNADGGSYDVKGNPRPIPLTTWDKAWMRYMARAGLSGWSRHNLRHYAGTFMAVDGKDLVTANAMLGHKDFKTTKIYVHNSGQRLQEAYSKCDPLASILVNTRNVKGKRKLL